MPTTTRTKSTRPRRKVSEAEKARRAEAVTELSGKLHSAVLTLATADGWLAAVQAIAGLDPRRYSANNNFLISLQCPGATAVAGAKEWFRRGRLIRKDETALRIFARLSSVPERDAEGNPVLDEDGQPKKRVTYKSIPVFDISQTVPRDGAELAPVPTIGEKVRGAAPEGMWSALAAHAERAGYRVERGDTDSADGWTNGATKVIRISATDPDAHATITLAHEVGHVECGHMDRMADYRTHQGRMETEAESVAYILAQWFGLDAEITSAPYIAGWAGSTPEAIDRTMSDVLANVVKAVCSVLDSIDPLPVDQDDEDEPEAHQEQADEAAPLRLAA